MIALLPRRRETQCTIEIEHTETSLHAHVTLDDDAPLGPRVSRALDGSGSSEAMRS